MSGMEVYNYCKRYGAISFGSRFTNLGYNRRGNQYQVFYFVSPHENIGSVAVIQFTYLKNAMYLVYAKSFGKKVFDNVQEARKFISSLRENYYGRAI